MPNYIEKVTVTKRADRLTITLAFKDALWLMEILHWFRMTQRLIKEGCPDFLHIEAEISKIQAKDIEKRAKK